MSQDEIELLREMIEQHEIDIEVWKDRIRELEADGE